MQVLLVAIVCMVLSGVVGYVLQNKQLKLRLSVAEKQAEEIEKNNQNQIKTAVAEINATNAEELQQLQNDEELEIEEQKTENEARSHRLDFREKSLEGSEARLNKSQQLLENHQAENNNMKQQVAETKQKARDLKQVREDTIYEKTGRFIYCYSIGFGAICFSPAENSGNTAETS